MHIPWWKRLDITQAAVALMTLKVLLPVSRIFQLSDTVDTVLLCVSIFLLFFSFNGKIISSLKRFFFALILCAIATYTCLIIDDFSILISVLSLAVLCFYDTRAFIRIIFWVSLAFFAVHFTIFLCYLPFGIPERFLLKSSCRMLVNFGTVHPNTFSSLCTSLTLMYLWLYGEKHRAVKLLFSLLLQFVVFYFTDSRAALYVNIVTLILLAWTYWKPPKKLLRFALCTVVPLLTIFMFVIMNLYIQEHPLALKINSILSNRVVLGTAAYDKFGLTLMGQYISFHDKMPWDPRWRLTGFTFDNIYSYLLVQGGLFWIALLSLCFIRASRKLSAKDMVFLLSWALYGMCENTVLNGYNLFPIFLLADTFRGQDNVSVKPLQKSKI